MTISRLLKPISILVTLLLTLQISANATAANVNAGKKGNTSNATITTIISGTDSARIKEDYDPDGDNLLEASGKLDITAVNSSEAAFIATTIYGDYGNLIIAATGNWFYAAENDQAIIQNLASSDTVTDTLTVSSVDGTTHPVVITIKGVNETGTTDTTITNSPAVISGVDTGSVTEDVDPDGDNLLEVAGKLDITDSDVGEAVFIATTVSGSYGGLMINSSGDWSYAADNSQLIIQNLASGATLIDYMAVSSIDGTTHTIVITIFGADEAVLINHPAVISGVDTGSVTEDVDPDGDNLLEVAGKLDITDNDAGEAAFIATMVNGIYGSLTINSSGDWGYAADNSQLAIQNLASSDTVTDSLTVSSIDGTTHTVAITIIGADEVGSLTDVTLSWVAPSQREDNTAIALSEIAGYKIYYGTTQGEYTNSVDINDGSAESYTFKAFPSGTYFFVVTTLDTEGRESQYSPEVKKVN